MKIQEYQIGNSIDCKLTIVCIFSHSATRKTILAAQNLMLSFNSGNTSVSFWFFYCKQIYGNGGLL